MHRALFFFFLIPALVHGQITFESKQSVEFYVKNVLMGPGVYVANVKHYGMIGGMGQFEADSSILGVKSGLVLSTGVVDSLHGPNNSSGYTSFGKFPADAQEQKKVLRGDRNMNVICKGHAVDMTVIEFDFVPVNNVLEFNYVFGSEEYPEYAKSKYDDGFGFFLRGPGIHGTKNLAVLPNGKTPVNVNSINAKKHSKYFRKNYGKINRMSARSKKSFYRSKKKALRVLLMKSIQLDGLTTVLKVHADLIPYQLYHMKIGIADASDELFDSAVFLQAGSFVSIADTTAKYALALSELKDDHPDPDSVLKGLKRPPPVKNIVAPPTDDEKFSMTNIYFDTDKNVIPDSSKKELDALVNYLGTHDTLVCHITGYADNSGNVNHNKKLSEKRAQAIRDYLVAHGIKPGKIIVEGYGIDDPDADNSTAHGRALNRRVEISLE
ncbi:MAG TPA: OmpA family protein [Bacteroidia bacterium]|nr:OmpA family protein [Bacteroidia bacterium]